MDFVEVLTELAKETGTTIGMFGLDQYEEAIAPHGQTKAIHALRVWYRTRKQNERLPSISELLKMMGCSERDDKDEIQETANRLWEAIGKFGYSARQQDVRAFVGEIGWHVATKNFNGWPQFCSATDTLDESGTSFFRKEIHEKVSHAYRDAANGRLGAAPQLPSGFGRASELPSGNEKPQTNQITRLVVIDS